jgi:hypothetical protein
VNVVKLQTNLELHHPPSANQKPYKRMPHITQASMRTNRTTYGINLRTVLVEMQTLNLTSEHQTHCAGWNVSCAHLFTVTVLIILLITLLFFCICFESCVIRVLIEMAMASWQRPRVRERRSLRRWFGRRRERNNEDGTTQQAGSGAGGSRDIELNEIRDA